MRSQQACRWSIIHLTSAVVGLVSGFVVGAGVTTIDTHSPCCAAHARAQRWRS